MFEQVLIESPGLLKRPLAVTISFTVDSEAQTTAATISIVTAYSVMRVFRGGALSSISIASG